MRLLSITIVALLASFGAAEAQVDGNASRGLNYAVAVCSECHAVEAGKTVSPDLKATPFQKVADTPGMTGMALNAWLHTPHPTMPNLIIEPDRILDLYAYIRSIRGAE